MPVAPTYPGVYVQEVPSGVRTIVGVATSITAFIGRTWKGPDDEPVTITSPADYERIFGGLWRSSSMSFAVRQFYQNGGNIAIIVRVTTRGLADAAAPAIVDLGAGTALEASSKGTWGRNLEVTVDHDTKNAGDFNLKIFDNPKTVKDDDNRGGSGKRETFLNVSVDSNSPRFVTTILEQQSDLVRTSSIGTIPLVNPTDGDGNPIPTETVPLTGDDGEVLVAEDIEGSPTDKTGIYALEKTDIFNLLCIPPLTLGKAETDDTQMSTWTTAAEYCEKRRAFLIVDAPVLWSISTGGNAATTNITNYSAIVRKNAAIYFPRLKLSDPLQEGRLEEFAPCGVVAGLMSRTDSERGIWKAPAGIEANLRGVQGVSIHMTDKENGLLNPLGINCIRNFPGIGTICWGARTLEGNDILASQWKYVPVRRLALYMEESLYRGLKWVVFEPNDEPLWSQIRLNVGAFMHNLFRQGAFQGIKPKDAYFVKCDSETTTQNDINLGIVNIWVGFAPLKPAEFVILYLQQMAGQIEV